MKPLHLTLTIALAAGGLLAITAIAQEASEQPEYLGVTPKRQTLDIDPPSEGDWVPLPGGALKKAREADPNAYKDVMPSGTTPPGGTNPPTGGTQPPLGDPQPLPSPIPDPVNPGLPPDDGTGGVGPVGGTGPIGSVPADGYPPGN